MATIEIGCTFVGDFKVGDSLGYNCDLLCNPVEANTGGAFDKQL